LEEETLISNIAFLKLTETFYGAIGTIISLSRHSQIIKSVLGSSGFENYWFPVEFSLTSFGLYLSLFPFRLSPEWK
jgi:hypothetical protein